MHSFKWTDEMVVRMRDVMASPGCSCFLRCILIRCCQKQRCGSMWMMCLYQKIRVGIVTPPFKLLLTLSVSGRPTTGWSSMPQC